MGEGGRGRGVGHGRGMEFGPDDMDIPEETEVEAEDNQVHIRIGGAPVQAQLLEYPTTKDGAISPIAEQEKKRPRRSEDGGEVNQDNPNARSALSFEESDRAQ